MKVYTWKQLSWAIFLIYVPVIILGLLTGVLVELLLVSTIVHIGWHYYFLKKLNDWLWVSRSTVLPQGKSVWEHAYIGIHNMQQRNRKRRNRLANVISRFREGSEALPDAVVVFKSDGEIVWCNRLAQYQLGFKWPDDAGDNITNLIRHPDFVEYLRSEAYNEPLDLISPINIDKILEFRVMPYAKNQRLLIVRDVTSYRQMDETRRNFVANVSHELRTPLTVLQGYIEILEMSAQDNKMQLKTINVLDQQTARMCSLVEQLMTLSKIEGAATLDFYESINIPALLTQIENEAVTLGRKKSQSVQFKVDPKLSVVGDEMQLRSAMSNLVYNAINYTPEGGSIKVLWKKLPEGAYFCVMDTGDGIAPEHILHLTERFYRVDASRSRDTGGSGLGLSIVKHALSHYDTQLQIESNVGEGSQFSFIIPNSYVH
ncbi:phosphate regulon sensor histidine kinase PhoR [Psychromonas sp. 14N.309.X.WAT.B.A12]|uniref:phosphate regulon sensor histidine kinase PhoR n=1 Tax=unclassified Psychromonas TaxID=2614957 RepID=UPI0025B0A3BD|nr:phosphate regulon sensor histidine kinase PhoR [Psychromonas sp. 14N.309.X.WAT.B.A12]MDN2663090.1 phosphate regulon sensor histidine kinase PhoR [Psychromonas sp. 14N.309.X.WAT.B.A12]